MTLLLRALKTYMNLLKYPGHCKLIFHLPNPDIKLKKPLIVLAHNIKVSINKRFIKQLRGKYGKENIRLE